MAGIDQRALMPKAAGAAPSPRSTHAGPRQRMADQSPRVRTLDTLGRALNGRPAAVAQRALAERLTAKTAAARPNRTGLPAQLKAGIEALSGLSMDDVRVHRNSPQPAQLNALAHAQGTDIHLAPGQDQHLPHEAWHVVQQKQGRVRATMQLKSGVAVNDDPALEREADAMGTLALRAGSARSAAPLLAATTSRGAATQGVAQRSVGFEFESGNAIADTEDKEKDLAKDHVYNGDGFHIDADTKNALGHNIEFVSDPRETVDAAEALIETMAAFAGTLVTGEVEEGDGWAADYTLTISDKDWMATMQHTEGVLLEDMAAFLDFNLENAGHFKYKAAMAGIDERHAALALDPKVMGFIHLVLHYLRTLRDWDGKLNEEGPKNAGPIMSRTDFHSIFGSLDEAQQAQFEARMPAELAAAGFDTDAPVIRKPYLQYEAGIEKPELKQNETTIGGWLASISEGYDLQDGGHVAKDHLSPPDGYEVFEPAYSMGAMGMDGDRVIIEIRDHGDATNLPLNEWATAPSRVVRDA